MQNKKVKAMLSAVALVAAAGGGICCAVKHGRKKKVADMIVNESVLHEEGLTEEKVKEYLLRLFRMYEDSEFDDLAESIQGSESDSREYVTDNYSGQLFLYSKRI